jgi:hypothetical protein
MCGVFMKWIFIFILKFESNIYCKIMIYVRGNAQLTHIYFKFYHNFFIKNNIMK